MLLGPAEPAIHTPPLCGQRERALVRRFGLVMKPAERSKVGFSMVITRHTMWSTSVASSSHRSPYWSRCVQRFPSRRRTRARIWGPSAGNAQKSTSTPPQ